MSYRNPLSLPTIFLLDFGFLWDFCFCFSFYLITLLEHLSSSPVFSGVRIARSIVLCIMLCRSLFVFLSFGHCVLRIMASDYPFGIFKLSLFFFISGGKILKYFTFYVKMFVVDPTNITTTVLREEFEDTKGYSESVYRRRTDNTMANRKSTKGQAIIYKTLQRKLKIE